MKLKNFYEKINKIFKRLSGETELKSLLDKSVEKNLTKFSFILPVHGIVLNKYGLITVRQLNIGDELLTLMPISKTKNVWVLSEVVNIELFRENDEVVRLYINDIYEIDVPISQKILFKNKKELKVKDFIEDFVGFAMERYQIYPIESKSYVIDDYRNLQKKSKNDYINDVKSQILTAHSQIPVSNFYQIKDKLKNIFSITFPLRIKVQGNHQIFLSFFLKLLTYFGCYAYKINKKNLFIYFSSLKNLSKSLITQSGIDPETFFSTSISNYKSLNKIIKSIFNLIIYFTNKYNVKPKVKITYNYLVPKATTVKITLSHKILDDNKCYLPFEGILLCPIE